MAIISLSVQASLTMSSCSSTLQSIGKAPGGKRLAQMNQSPNYKDGKFQNLSPSPLLAEGYTYTGVISDFFFRKKENRRPLDSIPSVKTDLASLPLNEDLLIWFGHSSYLLQFGGKRILVDPVLSGNAAPLGFMNKAFKGAHSHTAEDLPYIDYLLITHDHYDHLDYKTVKTLKNKVGAVICGLGVGAHFEKWGFPTNQIIERDWWEAAVLEDSLSVHLTPARHYSGRGVKRSNTLWTSYVVTTPTRKIYLGGDSGYGEHFKEIGQRFGPFDLAVLENGQYNPAWRNIHSLPEDVVQAGKDLNAKRVLPGHSSKFDLAGHPWNEPLQKITELSERANLSLVTPMIGEIVKLNDSTQTFAKWWQGLE